MTQYALFDTAIGFAGIAWNDAGLTACHLPERDQDTARRSFLRRFPEAAEAEVPAALAATVSGIQALMRGEKPDLSAVPLDLSRTPEFHARVYEIARAIPPGETLTYGEIAVKLGDRLLARDVGAALGKNPWPIVVPCHRVTAAGGKPGGFSARGGVNTKLKLLGIEGAAAAAQTDLFGVSPRVLTPTLERRLLQLTIAVAGLVPVGAGGWGALGYWHDESHARYLSGLLLGIGLTFWWTIPTIERRGAIVRGLAVIVVIGGLARLAASLQHGGAPSLPLAMELAVTPLIALWRERVERRLAPS